MLGAVHVAVVAVYGLVKNLGVDFVGLAEKNLFFGAVMIVKNSPSLTNRLDLWKITNNKLPKKNSEPNP